jgi:hypothetical protein
LQQQSQGVGCRVGGGLVRGDNAGHHHRMKVGVGDHLGVRHLLADPVAHPTRAIRVLAQFLKDVAGERPEIADRVGYIELLLWRGPAPGVDGVGDRVATQAFHVFLWNSEEVQGNRQRDGPEHPLHQICTALGFEAIDRGMRKAADHRIEMVDLARQERPHQQTLARHVHRLVLVH